ncbi:MAG: diaminopimelate epimerase [Acidimicrobiales bacterium]
MRSLQKWQGAGNDFLVDVQSAGEPRSWTSGQVRAICARATGVGADGLLVAALSNGATMTLFNADGSRAEMSGNGARCLAAAVRRATQSDFDDLVVMTDAGEKTVHLDMENDVLGGGSVEMGEVTFGDDLEGSWGVAYVGNPHVAVLDEKHWNDATREDLAAKFAAHMGGANVEFVSVLGPSHLKIRVIERGVGWTLACGTGSCAVAALARRHGVSGDEVKVENPGGTLSVNLTGQRATLSGPVQFVADVEWLEA